MISVISNSIYALRIRTPLIIIINYLIFFLINSIRLKKNYKVIERFEKNLLNLIKNQKIIYFTKNNIKYSIPIFHNILKKNYKSKNNLSVLILGIYEGHSTLFFHTFNKTWKINCVDSWNKSKFKNFNCKAEEYFNKNIIFFKKKIRKIKCTTKEFFLKNNLNYDFIYLDASHKSKDVKLDCINAWKILNISGIFIINSVFWREFKDLHDNNLNGINLFLRTINHNDYQIINITNNFLALKKIA